MPCRRNGAAVGCSWHGGAAGSGLAPRVGCGSAKGMGLMPGGADGLDLDSLKLRAGARLRALQQENEAAYRAHPWPFLRDAIWTLDQISGTVRKFPGDIIDPLQIAGHVGTVCAACGEACTNYLHCMVNVWAKTPGLLIPKSRRMMASWTMLACHYWLARYRTGSLIAVVSRKQGQTDSEGSNELVRRIKFMHDHLPPEVGTVPMEYQTGRIKFPSMQSEVLAFAQGTDQLRQYTVTAILFDEFAFWEKAQETYAASLPTLEGGGRLTVISSANPGAFEMLVNDEN